MAYIPEELRKWVIERAGGRCEYCYIHQSDGLYPHEVDHIIPQKHRGRTVADNLCFSCLDCNRNKGSDFASFDPKTDEVNRLFDPRQDQWEDHFQLESAYIRPLTATGRVTEFVLKLNDEHRIRARIVLIATGRYPDTTL